MSFSFDSYIIGVIYNQQIPRTIGKNQNGEKIDGQEFSKAEYICQWETAFWSIGSFLIMVTLINTKKF